MSAAAEERVQAFIHPKVKGCARKLLEQIAKQIPEGETMTAPMTIDDWAALTGYYEKSVRQARDVLVAEVQVLRIVGGGQGRRACYELLELPGAGELDPVLPLRADLRPVSRPPAGPLFEEVTTDGAPIEVRANTVGRKYRSWVSNIGRKYRCFLERQKNIGTFYRCWRYNIGTLYRSFRKRQKNIGTLYRCWVSAVDVDAREIRRSKYAEVDRAREGPHELEPGLLAASVEADAFLDWFAAEYAAVHHGAQCTISRAPDGGRITELLRGGRTVERLKDLAALMWTVTADGVVGSDRWYIAERVPVRNIWLLHRKADFLELELLRAEAESGESTAYTCPHTDPPCEQPNWRCRQRTALEAAKADDQRRQFG